MLNLTFPDTSLLSTAITCLSQFAIHRENFVTVCSFLQLLFFDIRIIVTVSNFFSKEFNEALQWDHIRRI